MNHGVPVLVSWDKLNPKKDEIASISVISPGTGYTGEPGGSISIYREEQLDKIAEQIWIARNPSHGDWEYASCKEAYIEVARWAVTQADSAFKS